MELKPTWLFSDLSLNCNRELDPFFKEFFAFVFRSRLSATKRPLICVRFDYFDYFDYLSFAGTPINEDSIVLVHSRQYYRNLIIHGRDQCEILWTPDMKSDGDTALFFSGFIAYALKNGIEIRRSPLNSKGVECDSYFPAVAWFKENRDSEDYDYILGKLYDYVSSNNCFDKLLDFYDGLGDMEGKAEFLNYCGRRGQFEQVELRL